MTGTSSKKVFARCSAILKPNLPPLLRRVLLSQKPDHTVLDLVQIVVSPRRYN
jgi:hypothetical protein